MRGGSGIMEWTARVLTGAAVLLALLWAARWALVGGWG